MHLDSWMDWEKTTRLPQAQKQKDTQNEQRHGNHPLHP
jgi:hypothetical protein